MGCGAGAGLLAGQRDAAAAERRVAETRVDQAAGRAERPVRRV